MPRNRPFRFSSAQALAHFLTAAAVAASATGCLPQDAQDAPASADPVSATSQALSGENQAGYNLGGSNLGGSNLAGSNLAGPNLGGSNLAGSNLGGSNLGGSNLGGNNLGGSNLAGSNLGGSNLAGSNLGGSNMSGKNLAGSNLGGSNLAGSNIAGNNLAGSNLAGSNLAGSNSGANIHSLSGTVNGMLYSGEDIWSTKPYQCIVMGIGSTAFPKLLGQQSANAKMSVALGKLPWGFATSSGGSINLQAWEAVVWGDKTYCVFVMAAPPSTPWSGVAGFIKAVFRWNAPPTQSIDISGIEASAAIDPTINTGIITYPGMMDTASKWRAGTLSDFTFLAGELAFTTATTNNISVLVDFSSWVQDKNKNAVVLGNVTATSPPTYAEALYMALDNGDGTVSIVIDDAASRTNIMPAGMTNSVVDLDVAYMAWQSGLAPKPVPRRCDGALFLNAWFGEPVPAGKCDSGLTWSSGFCSTGSDPWSAVSGTTGPMNGYMSLTKSGGAYKRATVSNGVCGTMKPVISETYVHMWDKNYDLTAGACTPESDASLCSRWGRNCGSMTATDNCGNKRTVSSCGGCGSPATCGGSGIPNVCGVTTARSYEAESSANTLSGTAVTNVCVAAYTKMMVAGAEPGLVTGACSGGGRIRFIGGGSSNYVTVNNVNVPTAGNYTMTVWAMALDARTYSVSVNGGTATTLNVQTPRWDTSNAFPMTVTLKAGNNTIKFSNSSAMAPDLDRIVISGGPGTTCTAETDAQFCFRLARNCGSVTSTDNCGNSRTVASCGSCASGSTCGGGGTANVCGGGTSGGGSTCAPAYSQSGCLSLYAGVTVSSGGHNWTCANANCMNCATYAGCAPGATGCPWGAVWTDAGTCN